MKLTTILAAALAFGAPAMVQAQDLTTPAAGRQVVDPRGEYVATIVSVDAASDTAVVDTGSRRAIVALSRFGRSSRGPMLVTTRAQLDDLIAQAEASEMAALAASIIVGASVYDSDGVLLGAITEIAETGSPLIEGTVGAFYLPRTGFQLVNGQLQALATTAAVTAQLEAL